MFDQYVDQLWFCGRLDRGGSDLTLVSSQHLFRMLFLDLLLVHDILHPFFTRPICACLICINLSQCGERMRDDASCTEFLLCPNALCACAQLERMQSLLVPSARVAAGLLHVLNDHVWGRGFFR